MEYQEVLRRISGTKKLGKKAGLSRMRRLMELMGNPQDGLRFIHIAGTNGKGSTAAFLAEILQGCGYRTGLFTSPFLSIFNERIRIDGEMISDEALCSCAERVMRAAETLEGEGEEYPTEFEFITAMGFCYFAGERCDVVVLEVGLGGRFDATNIIACPPLAVITAIGLDHTQYLGDTLEKIAFEKCGIIKEGGTVICCGGQPSEALAEIRRAAGERGAELVVCDTGAVTERRISAEGNTFRYGGIRYRTRLCGAYQIDNALTAITAAETLAAHGWAIPGEKIREGLAGARWPGRMETLCVRPRILADGSHNPDGMRAFAATAAQVAGTEKLVCVVGMVRDKDCDAALAELAKAVRRVVMTTVENPRAMPAEELARLAGGRFEKIACRPDVGEALRLAVEMAGEDGAVFAVGSLYLVGSVRGKIAAQGREVSEKVLN